MFCIDHTSWLINSSSKTQCFLWPGSWLPNLDQRAATVDKILLEEMLWGLRAREGGVLSGPCSKSGWPRWPPDHPTQPLKMFVGLQQGNDTALFAQTCGAQLLIMKHAVQQARGKVVYSGTCDANVL